ncbi:metalloprotease PmbA [bacterium MnTg04]|nr:metalloprotease PmbA [bacterium MnTg04]
MGEVETLESQRDRYLGITVFFGQQKGSASTTDLGSGAVADTVRKACSIARFTSPDPYSGLADAALMAAEFPELDLYHPWNLPAAEAIDLATRCEAAALTADQRIENSEGATVSSSEGVAVYGNSHGFMGAKRGTSHSASCVIIAKHGREMQRDYWYTSARDPGELMDLEALGKKAAQRALARLGSRKLDTREAQVLFPAELARSLLGHLVAAVRGTAQYRKASYLCDAIGRQVLAAGINVFERPHLKKAVGSTAFDSEGVATTDRDLASDGVLQGYVLNSYTARKLGMTTTANGGGVHNLELEAGLASPLELMEQMGSGLLLTELIGQGVNILTGDYSRGAAGFWVENGKIQFPVHEITIAGNLAAMLTGIVAVGNDLDVRSGIRTPSLLLSEMTIAGN